jgi:photosystem II stability/assembly factor-like uncharacterized protein
MSRTSLSSLRARLGQRGRLSQRSQRGRAGGASRARAPLLVALALVGALAVVLQGCEIIPGPVQIKIADPSPKTTNSTTFSSPGFQSPSGRVISVAVSKDGQRVYAGTARGGLWRSDDGGSSWQQLSAPQPGDNTRTCADADPRCSLPALTIADLHVSPDNPDILLAAVAYDDRLQSLDGIYRTTDGGKTWALAFQFNCNGSAAPVTSFAVASDDSTQLWAAGGCGVAYSQGQGDTVGSNWTLVNLPDNGAVYAVAAGQAQGSGRFVYACGGSSLYYSLDGGRTYAKDPNASAALPASACAQQRFDGGASSDASALAVAPGHPEQVYVTAQTGGNGPLYFLDGHANGAACDPTNLACGGSLWLGDFAGTTASGLHSSWRQLASPPVYRGAHTSLNSGSVGVWTLPQAGGSYLVLYLDTNTLHVSAGPPAADSWHRLDGPDASTLSRSGASLGPDAAAAFQPLHVNPRTLASTPDFAISLAAPPAGDPAFSHNTELNACGGGALVLAGDGGVYRSVDCGQTWQQATDLESLSAYMLAGLPRPNSTNPYKLPAVYFGTLDNHDWYSIDGGLHWRGGDDVCASCFGYWSDPVRGDLVVHPMPNEGLRLYVGVGGDAPDLYDSRTISDVGFPATLGLLTPGGYTNPAASTYFGAVTDAAGWRPVVLTKPGEPAGAADLVMIAPAQTPTVAPTPGSSADLVVYRKQTVDAGSTGWAVVSPVLPAGATILQAAGGHANPTYYVGDRVAGGDGSLFDLTQQGNHLYRSHNSGGTVDGWDCIVPGPAHPGTHDGQCASAGKGVSQAWAFASDPYDANIVYILDTDGVKLSTDGGKTWQKVQSLSDWIFEGGRLGAACRGVCGVGPLAARALTGMEFVPDEPKMRFATGAAGVFFTNDGATANGNSEDWHRLLDTSALACLPRGTYFDKANTVGRALYVACAGRSLLSFVGIPKPGDQLDYTLNGGGQYPYPPVLSSTNPTPTPGAASSATPGPGYAVDFRVVPQTDYQQSCASGLQPMTFKLDNTRSGGPVTWTLTIKDTDPAGQPWTTFDTGGGTIKGGEIGTLTLSPIRAVCSDMSAASVSVKTYTTILTYTGGHQVVLSDTISVK